jgi:alpha-tubulin suppressor-like RCC1 family protein
MKCPTCGQICRNNRKVCALCGTPLNQKRSHGGLIALIVILVLILGGLVAYRLLPGGLLPGRGAGQPAELVSYEEPQAGAAEEAPKEPLSGRPEGETQPEEESRTEGESEPESGLLFENAAEIYALPSYSLALCRDGSVKLAGRSASPEFGFDLFDWQNIRQVVATDYFIAGLTESGRVRLTGEVSGYEEAARWTDVTRLYYDAGTLLGLTADGRVLAAGPELNADPSDLKDIVEIIPGTYDTLALASDGRVFVLKRSGALWDAEGKIGLADLAIGPEFVLYLLEDGTVSISSMLWHFVQAYNLPTPSYYSWENIRQLVILDHVVAGLTREGTVLCGTHLIEELSIDPSSWTHVVKLIPDGDAGILFGLTEDGHVLVTPEGAAGEVASWENVQELQLNRHHAAALTRDGRVLTWARDGAAVSFDTREWTDVVAIALGEEHLLALRADGGVLAVGDNSFGQCGPAA